MYNIGNTICWDITITNNGPDNNDNIIVTDLLDSNLSFISATISGTTTPVPYNATTGAFDLSGTELFNGDSISITLCAEVIGGAGTDITNTATVTSNIYDPDTNDNTSDSTVTILNPTITATPSTGNDGDEGTTFSIDVSTLFTANTDCQPVTYSGPINLVGITAAEITGTLPNLTVTQPTAGTWSFDIVGTCADGVTTTSVNISGESFVVDPCNDICNCGTAICPGTTPQFNATGVYYVASDDEGPFEFLFSGDDFSTNTVGCSGTESLQLDWGDGTIEPLPTSGVVHTYPSVAGSYIIKVFGTDACGNSYELIVNQIEFDSLGESVYGDADGIAKNIITSFAGGRSGNTVDFTNCNDIIVTIQGAIEAANAAISPPDIKIDIGSQSSGWFATTSSGSLDAGTHSFNLTTGGVYPYTVEFRYASDHPVYPNEISGSFTGSLELFCG